MIAVLSRAIIALGLVIASAASASPQQASGRADLDRAQCRAALALFEIYSPATRATLEFSREPSSPLKQGYKLEELKDGWSHERPTTTHLTKLLNARPGTAFDCSTLREGIKAGNAPYLEMIGAPVLDQLHRHALIFVERKDRSGGVIDTLYYLKNTGSSWKMISSKPLALS